jgi:hypothetical protein
MCVHVCVRRPSQRARAEFSVGVGARQWPDGLDMLDGVVNKVSEWLSTEVAADSSGSEWPSTEVAAVSSGSEWLSTEVKFGSSGSEWLSTEVKVGSLGSEWLSTEVTVDSSGSEWLSMESNVGSWDNGSELSDQETCDAWRQDWQMLHHYISLDVTVIQEFNLSNEQLYLLEYTAV